MADPADGVDPAGNVESDDDDDYWGDIGFGSFSYSHPDAVYQVNRQYLDGTWVGTSVETADGRIPLETAGESLTLTFMSADGVTGFMGEGVWSMVCQYDATYSNGERETLNELHIKFLGGPMYHDCGNQEWFAALGGGPKGVEFNVTVIDNNYLELRRFGEGPHQMWIVYCERSDGLWWNGQWWNED